MQEDLETLLEIAGQYARLVMIVLGQNLMPSWTLVTPRGVRVIATPWRNDREKQAAKLAIKKAIKDLDARAYSCVVEAWAAPAPAGFDPEQEEINEADLPRERVDRIECVVAVAVSPVEQVWREWRTMRDWQGKVVALEASAHKGISGGWIANLFG